MATDAIGMGLNMDVDHVAFAGLRKFDGRGPRRLTPAEIGQIAGRAGRHMSDGTFGVTGEAGAAGRRTWSRRSRATASSRCASLQWRNAALDFASLDGLLRSLDERAARAPA